MAYFLLTVCNFADCIERGAHPTLTGLANSLDISYDTFQDWERDKTKPFHDTIRRAKMLVRDFEEQAGIENKMNTILAIFRSKAVWGLIETSALTIAPPHDPFDGLTSPEELRKKYMSAIPEGDYD